MSSEVLASIFPERRVANFVHRDERIVFFSLLSELVEPSHVVLDFGAGRGRHTEMGGRHLRAISNFMGRCQKLIGTDVDEVVLQNPAVDQAVLIGPDGKIPLPDASVDIIYSYAVFEHIDDPSLVVAELTRVLKPGGWLCAWTPNRWGYVGIGARLIPNNLHAALLKFISPGGREEKDVFPVRYRLNTIRSLRHYFTDFDDFSFVFNSQPSYNFGSKLVARLILLYMLLTPRFLGKSLMVFMRKKH